MEVSQEVSDYATQSVLGTDQFIFTKRSAQTNVIANDGQTIVIGGLIQDHKETTSTGIPYLMNIPVLGYLLDQKISQGQKRKSLSCLRRM